MNRLPVTVARLRRIRTGFPILPDSSSGPPGVNNLIVLEVYSPTFRVVNVLQATLDELVNNA